MRLLAGSLCVALVCVSGAASADPKPADAAAARALFDDARKLMAKGEYVAACPKLEEGVKLNPGLGMRANLADCWEHLGKTASAWALYLDVAASAKEKKDAVKERDARKHADSLESQLSRLIIIVSPSARTAGLEIKRGDAVVGEGQWGTGIAIDPQKLTVTATAPGKKPWRSEINLDKPGSFEVTVPPLEDLPKPVLPPERVQVPISRFTWPVWATLGVGVAGLGVGGAFGALAIAKNNESKPNCNAANVCNQPGLDARNAARSQGDVSTIFFGVGIAGIAAAATIYALNPSSRTVERPRQSASLTLLPSVPVGDRGFAGMTVSGRW